VKDIPGHTFEEYQYGWVKAQEMMALSLSMIHFEHDILALENSMVAKINAILVNVALLSSSTPV